MELIFDTKCIGQTKMKIGKNMQRFTGAIFIWGRTLEIVEKIMKNKMADNSDQKSTTIITQKRFRQGIKV